eukprot:TRINITY_DN88102_c0_g1_i1.p1 TRINITY_DN88102_c0_g1~~TRINITY_DN88102_c0_g1_i1.p1  ORF type:complete len:591 (-),score=274.22 TRINITY_DN88102_c0_g1_i1:16-1569(-)
MRKDERVWSRRPIRTELLEYAALDVKLLSGANSERLSLIYDRMVPEKRRRVEDGSEARATLPHSPESASSANSPPQWLEFDEKHRPCTYSLDDAQHTPRRDDALLVRREQEDIHNVNDLALMCNLFPDEWRSRLVDVCTNPMDYVPQHFQHLNDWHVEDVQVDVGRPPYAVLVCTKVKTITSSQQRDANNDDEKKEATTTTTASMTTASSNSDDDSQSQLVYKVQLSGQVADRSHVGYVLKAIGGPEMVDHLKRGGVDGTLHRIAFIRGKRDGVFVGLTARVGRNIVGAFRMIEDIVYQGKSILLIGKPGLGKTSVLRDISHALATQAHRHVMIVDTSGEIGGWGDEPHRAVAGARRMHVPAGERQANIMLEAVRNHRCETLVIDEIGTRAEAREAIAIAARGVQLIATAHGTTLGSVMDNTDLQSLLGGQMNVILSAGEARDQRVRNKAQAQRAKKPAFDICIELRSRTKWHIYTDVAAAIDRYLRKQPMACEVRELVIDQHGNERIQTSSAAVKN